MAHKVRITSEGEEAVASATVETLAQARGVTTGKYECVGAVVSFDLEQTTEQEVAFIEIGYQTTDGTATGATEVAADPDDPTPALTGFHSFSAEPTKGTVFAQRHVPLSGGTAEVYLAAGDGNFLDSATTSRIGVWVTTSAACNAAAELVFEPVAV